ncbi:hypothetical protein CPC16_007613 [Podila verticillata]|nr:hypothetical protein CPC16_007613 [Podila verticillata]
MDETQSFRLIGRTNIIKIPVKQVQGQTVIYWDDIELFFSGVKYVMNGDVGITLMRDSKEIRLVPHCIKHYPGDILDVILSTAAKHVSEDFSMATSSLTSDNGPADTPTLAAINPDGPGAIIDEFNINPPLSSTEVTLAESVSSLAIATEPFSDLSFAEFHQATATRGNTVNIHSQLDSVAMIIEQARQGGLPFETVIALINSKLAPAAIATPGFETVIRLMVVLYNQGATTQQIVRELNDRLILIQSKIEVILTQQLELLEFTIPRLFCVLPEEVISFDPANWIRTKFRLHFICECGDHTKANNPKIPHKPHLTHHLGYLIREPVQFFKKYGPFLTVMLEMLKLGTSVAGHLVPGASPVVSATRPGIDYALNCLEAQRKNSIQSGQFNASIDGALAQDDLTAYLNGAEGLEGVELRQLGSFLKTDPDCELLGYLYRMTTTDGHVKWVCKEHYRIGYLTKQTEKLRELVQAAGGEFDVQRGKITVTARTSAAAEKLFQAIKNARGIIELDITLGGMDDRRIGFGHGMPEEIPEEFDIDVFEKFKDAVMNSNLAILYLNILSNPATGLDFDGIGRRRYDPVFELLHHKTLHHVYLQYVPSDFIKRAGPPTTFSNLKCLALGCRGFGGFYGKSLARWKSVLHKAQNLSALEVGVSGDGILQAYQIISDFPTWFSVKFYPWLIIEGSKREPRKHPKIDSLEEFIASFVSPQVIIAECELNEVPLYDKFCVDALVYAASITKSLQTLVFQNYRVLEPSFVQIVLCSPLVMFGYESAYEGSGFEAARKAYDSDRRILQSLRWENLRHLKLNLKNGDGSNPLQPLTEVAKMNLSLLALDSLELKFHHEPTATEFSVLEEFLGRFRLERLRLYVNITADQALWIVESIDFSRLKELMIAEYFNFQEWERQEMVEVILNRNVMLETLCVKFYGDEQETRRLNDLGINLPNDSDAGE